MEIGEIIGLVVAGIIIGALARLVLPGETSMPIWMHLIIGVVGVLIGYWIAGALGLDSTEGIDWLRWIISIAVAALAIVVVDRVTAGSRT